MKIFYAFFFVMFIANFSVYGQSNTVEIWMRAFIPDPINAGGGRGYINSLPTGGSSVSLHNSDSSIPNMCFATDHRGFSDNPKVSSRLETKFTLILNLDGTGKIVPAQNRTTSAITKKVDCKSGTILEQKMGSISRDNIGTPSVADDLIQVIGQVQGRNLLTPLGNSGPAIDYNFDIKWNASTSKLTAAVTVGSFPAFELYARQPNGKWISVIKYLPTGAPWKLGGDGFGINSSRIVETKVIN